MPCMPQPSQFSACLLASFFLSLSCGKLLLERERIRSYKKERKKERKMTSYSIVTNLLLSFIIIISSTLLLLDFASAHRGCAPGYGCSFPYNPIDDHHDNIYQNRKMLMGLMRSSITGTVADEEIKETMYGEELRNVPSGPDPLHHKGGPEKRPRISP